MLEKIYLLLLFLFVGWPVLFIAYSFIYFPIKKLCSWLIHIFLPSLSVHCNDRYSAYFTVAIIFIVLYILFLTPLTAFFSSSPEWMGAVFVVFGAVLYVWICYSLVSSKESDSIQSANAPLKHEIISLKEKNYTLSKSNDMLSKKCSQLESDNARLCERDLVISEKESIINITESNLSAIPYMASIIADFDTRGIELLARQLDWGDNQERKKKVASIRDIRKQAQTEIAKYKEAQYQLEYAMRMFPALEDFLETDYRTIQETDFSVLSSENHDRVRNYLSKEEYLQLSTTERNQLALNRYRESHRKTSWQIGRDYELYIGYRYESKGYEVEYFGSLQKLEDLGRDLIAKKGNRTLIIQCKYWSSKKQIHEKHIMQLYGTMIAYCFEHKLPRDSVHGILVTNITVSDTARRFSQYLDIEIAENVPLKEYPCIKCNINRSAEGGTTRIYHLPFDQQYDACVINSPGEFMALTVAEAEQAGFRRAYRWYNN